MKNNHYSVTDKVQIIGKKNKRFDNIEIIATNQFISIGSQQIHYQDILKIIESISSDRLWILLTNHGIIQIISSSIKERNIFIQFIQFRQYYETITCDIDY